MYTSAIASATLIAYVPLAIAIHLSLRRDLAVAYLMIGAVLFLPELVFFDAPGIPPLHKHSIPALVTFAYLATSQNAHPVKPSKFFWWVAACLLLGDLGTVLTNRGPLLLAPGLVSPGFGVSEVISRTVVTTLTLLLPYLIARSVFRSPEQVLTLLKVVATLGVIYAFLMLIEIRLSPQLHNWVYGYLHTGWGMTKRGGGFRPVVFMTHGLATTLFLVTVIFATITLGKVKEKVVQMPAYAVFVFLLLVLALSNSMGSLIYGVLCSPILLFAPPRFITFLATFGSAFILSVPLLRMADVLPLDDVISTFVSINPDRAQSLEFRFFNEELILEKWQEQPWFGYGSHGRDRVYDDGGNDITVLDGAWIIALIQRGIVGFLGMFLLLLGPIWMARKRVGMIKDRGVRALFTGLVITVLVSTFDLLLNGLFHCLPLFFAGALAGLSEHLAALDGPSSRAAATSGAAAGPAMTGHGQQTP